MLVKLHVKGFKGLNLTAHLGPLIFVVGANGSGKSNLLDAIQFLSDLARHSITEAAKRVRDPVGCSGDVRSLFSRNQSGNLEDMHFDVDFIVPHNVKDDFNREANPTASFLNYKLVLRYVAESASLPERIVMVSEDLTYIKKNDARRRLRFWRSAEFIESAIYNNRSGPGFISTEHRQDLTFITLHGDQGVHWTSFYFHNTPDEHGGTIYAQKTILGQAMTDEYPTVLAARREMQSWTHLQLEPSALRKPDAYSDDANIASNGAHMPATLWRIGKQDQVSIWLAKFIDGIKSVSIDSDDSLRVRTLLADYHDGAQYSAMSLSDGTLKVLALAILAEDKESWRLLCLEDFEASINRSSIDVVIDLLKSMVVNVDEPIGDDNPLRQAIVSTQLDSSDLVDKNLFNFILL